MEKSLWGTCMLWIVGYEPKKLINLILIQCHTILKCSWLSLVEGWVNFKITLWGSQYFYIDLSGPHSILHSFMEFSFNH